MATIQHGLERKKAGTIETEDGKTEDFFLPVLGQVTVDMSFIQYYHWTLSQLCKLTPGASELVQYLSIHMGQGNTVVFTKPHKMAFCEEMKDENGRRKYELRSVDNYLLELKKKNLIRRVGDINGYFVVNPKYFFKTTATDRIEAIKMYLTFQENKELQVEVTTRIKNNGK